MEDEDEYQYIGCIHAERADALPVEVAETQMFEADAKSLLSHEERMDLRVNLAIDPEQGYVIPGTGGVRGMRVKGNGKGKRGGHRVIYYYHDNSMPLYLLAIYSKNEKIKLTEYEKAALQKYVRDLVREYRGKGNLKLIS